MSENKNSKYIIDSGIPQLRDPCILYDGNSIYAYGTDWICYSNSTGNLSGPWQGPFDIVQKPPFAISDFWAPEVHKYNGSYYMFTTYFSSVTNHRGCTIMKADSPLGPFTEISAGHVTPADWDCIDGTLYVDESNQPWLIFVHEWTCTDDNIGRMAAAKLSEDLTAMISKPIELFRADDAPWAIAQVTDGCWMYRTQKGSLLMIWSNFSEDGYAVGIARSTSGCVEGPWVHEEKRLFSSADSGLYDGGHGMIFHDESGQMYLSVHSPNTPCDIRREMPVFVKIREENDTLVWGEKF